MDKPSSTELAAAATRLIASCRHAVVSTLSTEFEGYPFGSVVPYCLDASGKPLLLLSHLAQHTKNLIENPKASMTFVAPVTGDVQRVERLVSVGEVEAVNAAAEGERFFRYFPDSRIYAEQLNFRFFRFEPLRWHFNAGFATARWFANDRVLATNSLGESTEAGVVAHMNADHRDALVRYLSNAGIEAGDDSVRMCGADAHGIDIAVGELIHRIGFPRPVSDATALRALLVEMAQES